MKVEVNKITVSVTLLGVKLDAQGVTISTGVNSIPSVELSCAPDAGMPASPLKPVVERPSISFFSGLYRRLSELAYGLNTKGDVSIKVENEKSKDSISLKGWVLSGVGMSSVGAEQAPYLNIIMQHPICKLTKVGSIYETPKSDYQVAAAQEAGGATSFLEVVKKVYELVSSGIGDMLFMKSPDGSSAPEWRHALGKAEHLPNTYLEEKYPGASNKLFLGSFLGAGTVRMSAAISALVLPEEGGTSTWDMLQSVGRSLLLGIVQDQDNNYTTDKLVLSPMRPWVRPSITINENRCAWTELPGMDSFRISGVSCRKLETVYALGDQGYRPVGNPKQNHTGAEVMYVPEGVTPSMSDGKILKTSAPWVLAQMHAEDAPYGTVLNEAKTKAMAVYKNDYDKALMSYCKALYESTVASTVTARVQMALSFHQNGSSGPLIVPGVGCKMKAEGETIYYGYINNVTHSLSTGGGCATILDLAYVRGTPGHMVGGVTAIPLDANNAAYTEG